MFNEHEVFSSQGFLTVNQIYYYVMMALELHVQSVELLLHSLRMVDDSRLTDVSF